MYKFFYILTLSGIILFTSCKKDKEVFDAGFAYYPSDVGNYKVYQVQKVVYLPNDTTIENFEIKEVVAEQFTINGEPRYRLERFKRLLSSDPWPVNPDSVWSVAITSSKVVRVEDNIRFVKLIFPIENGKSWNGNTENDLGNDEYDYKKVGQPYTVLGQTYSATAQVLQSPNDSTPVNKDYRMEVFAKDIGLIYKVKETYEYNQACWGCGKIDEGIKYYEKLSSYGH